MDGETYFLARGYSQPRNIVLFAEECLGPEMASATPLWTQLFQKSLLGFVYFCTGAGQCFQHRKRLNWSIWLIQTLLAFVQGVHKLSQVMEISIGHPLLQHIIKRRHLTVLTTDSICAAKLDHTKIATCWYAATQIRPRWNFSVLCCHVSRLVTLKRKLRGS